MRAEDGFSLALAGAGRLAVELNAMLEQHAQVAAGVVFEQRNDGAGALQVMKGERELYGVLAGGAAQWRGVRRHLPAGGAASDREILADFLAGCFLAGFLLLGRMFLGSLLGGLLRRLLAPAFLPASRPHASVPASEPCRLCRRSARWP